MKIKVSMRNILNEKLLRPDAARKTKHKNVYHNYLYNYFLFSKFYTFKFVTFSNNQQIWEVFQKHFAGGICDFKGGGLASSMYSATPYKYLGCATRSTNCPTPP